MVFLRSRVLKIWQEFYEIGSEKFLSWIFYIQESILKKNFLAWRKEKLRLKSEFYHFGSEKSPNRLFYIHFKKSYNLVEREIASNMFK